MRAAEALLSALRDAGARKIFGIPGDFALPLFEVIERTQVLPLYTLSHEPAVGFAADAAVRFHGGLGVATITYGAGAFNLVNSIAGAYAERSPVVVLSVHLARRTVARPARAPQSTEHRIAAERLSRDHLPTRPCSTVTTTAAESIARVLRSARSTLSRSTSESRARHGRG